MRKQHGGRFGQPPPCLQVFLDVVESVNLLVNSNGTVVRSEVVGALKMRTYLSGMPECKLGLNDKASVPVVQWHSARRASARSSAECCCVCQQRCSTTKAVA